MSEPAPTVRCMWTAVEFLSTHGETPQTKELMVKHQKGLGTGRGRTTGHWCGGESESPTCAPLQEPSGRTPDSASEHHLTHAAPAAERVEAVKVGTLHLD